MPRERSRTEPSRAKVSFLLKKTLLGVHCCRGSCIASWFSNTSFDAGPPRFGPNLPSRPWSVRILYAHRLSTMRIFLNGVSNLVFKLSPTNLQVLDPPLSLDQGLHVFYLNQLPII